MSKNQKILLAIALALFFVPEILWSPVGNYIYELMQLGGTIHSLRNNFLTNSDNYGFIWYGLIVLFEIFGLSISLWLLIKMKTLIRTKAIYLVLFPVIIILLILSVISFYFVSFVQISFP